MQRMNGERERFSDALVVGGGMAGLVSSIVLASGGLKVTLLEKSAHAGGRAITRELEGGYYFNLGAHALYRKGAAQRILRELGVSWTGALPPAKKGRVVYKGRKFISPAGTLSLLMTGLLSFREKMETARILASLSRINTESLAGVPLGAWLDSLTRSERVKQLLCTIVRVTTYTNDTEHLSAGAVIEQVRLGLEGSVDYLDHGWQTLVDGARARALEAGVQILTGASVVKVRREAEGYAVHLRSGEAFHASEVVLATSPGAAASIVEGDEETALGRWARACLPVHVACLDVALKRLPLPGSNHFALGVDRPLYCIVHSVSARLAPEGGAVVHLMKYQATGEAGDARADRREMEELLDLMQPGWRELIAHARFLPRMTASNALVTAEGGGAKGRPGPEVPDMPGLYVAGDWVGAEGMLLDASLASAHHAAQLVLKRQTKERARLSPSQPEAQRLIA